MTISNKIRTIAVESLNKVHDVDAKIKKLESERDFVRFSVRSQCSVVIAAQHIKAFKLFGFFGNAARNLYAVLFGSFKYKPLKARVAGVTVKKLFNVAFG